METSQASTLPTFKLGDSYTTPFGPKNKEVLVVELLCQRSWCQGVTVVEVSKWWSRNLWERERREGKYSHLPKAKFRSRPCTYCGNMHKVPKKPKRLE